jgi:hypothetical protein
MPQAAPVQKPASQQDKQALALQKIRPELNLEKWPIWQPAKSKNQPQVRLLRREITLDNGDKVTAQVEVGFTQRGELTTEDQRTYYALIEHWEAHNKPGTFTPLSLNKLAKRLNKKWGTNVIQSVTDSLIRLRATTLIWENSYFDSELKETIELLDTFNILTDLKIIKRKKDGVVNREVGYYRFNDFILKNLQSNHTKPLLLGVVLSFKSEIAQLLYTHLDLILNDKIAYERRTKELFADLYLTGKAYKNPSNRKQVLTRALKELQGVPLSRGGIIASATLEKTKDQKDYKVVFRKGSAAKSAPALEPQIEEDVQAATPALALPAVFAKTDQKAQELITHFYKLFHNVQTHAATSKELAQAASIIAQYGWNIALYIVDYAYREAPKTEYQPKTFGGIMHYASHAFSDYERRQKERERQEQSQAAATEQRRREQAEGQARHRAQERYEQLSETERQVLTDAYTAKLCEENPAWAETKEKGGLSLLNAAVRSAILEDFIAEEHAESREASAPTQE